MNKRNKEIIKLSLYILSTLIIISSVSMETFYIVENRRLKDGNSSKEKINLSQYVSTYKNTYTDQYMGVKIMEDIYNKEDLKDIKINTVSSDTIFNDISNTIIITNKEIQIDGNISNSIIIAPITINSSIVNHSFIYGIGNIIGSIGSNNSFIYFSNAEDIGKISSTKDSLFGFINYYNDALRGYKISPNDSYIDVKQYNYFNENIRK